MDKQFSRSFQFKLSNPKDCESIKLIGKALSNGERIEILKLLNVEPHNINEISRKLKIPLSSVSNHINVLEDAGLILTEFTPTVKGHMKLCSRLTTDFSVNIWEKEIFKKEIEKSYEMPVGLFSDASIDAPCGQSGVLSHVIREDEPGLFFTPERINTSLIWFKSGYLKYQFPNEINENQKIKQIEFSLELCSEAAFYRQEWPSDITFSLNNIELLTYTSPGDYGDKRGLLNPNWWPDYNTQYGDLIKIKINNLGVFLDNKLVNNKINIKNINCFDNKYFEFKIEVKKNSPHVGGINIFGKNFGNHKQDIIMNISLIKS